MALNKSTGQMYNFCTHTWNSIKGDCPFSCSYCYVKDIKKRYGKPDIAPYLDEKCFKDNLGSGNYIFVGSSNDMWAADIPAGWINQTLCHCAKFPENKYLFQTKNPQRFRSLARGQIGAEVLLACTIESNRDYNISKAPTIYARAAAFGWIGSPKMVSIEPVLDFDVGLFVQMLHNIDPNKISIGADSKGHGLPEPNKTKLKALIVECKKFAEVLEKPNLARLLK